MRISETEIASEVFFFFHFFSFHFDFRESLLTSHKSHFEPGNMLLRDIVLPSSQCMPMAKAESFHSSMQTWLIDS